MKKYTLIIAEKPDAANRIAMALDADGKPERNFKNGVPIYEVHQNENLVVVSALGHLYTVAGKRKADRNYPIFDYQWVPRHLAERKASKIKAWLKVISEIAENAESFIDACDFDVEGSIIGYFILKDACGGKEKIAQRMKYSTLTKDDLQESYRHPLPNLDFALIQAGLARHEVDWLYGINLSRALTNALKASSGYHATLSTGRVQGPTLKFLEEREKTIHSFVPTAYWTLTAKGELNGNVFDAEYERIIESEEKASQILELCKTTEGKVYAVDTDRFEQKPPLPFDLGALQSEAYRIFKYSPVRTLAAAQHLYVGTLISYPRTSSQKLPPTIGYRKILRKLSRDPAYAEHSAELLSKSSLKPIEGGKVDSAHPAIYPTGNLPEKPLDVVEGRIFDLIVRRFLAVFGEPAIREGIKITINLNGNNFYLNGVCTIHQGWLRLYPFVRLKEVVLPPLVKDQKIAIKKVILKANSTKPPSRYNLRSLLLKMELEEIGTKATRAAIMQTLQNRKYVVGNDSMRVSKLGSEVVEILTKYCPAVVSTDLTRNMEKKMEEIQQGNLTKERVVEDAIEILKPALSELKNNETVVGLQLNEALKKIRLEEKTVGSCPRCSDGRLTILRSKKSGKRFIGCTNFFLGTCNLTFPLPQSGIVKALGTLCKTCSHPMVSVREKGKKSWKLCINPNCPSKIKKP